MVNEVTVIRQVGVGSVSVRTESFGLGREKED